MQFLKKKIIPFLLLLIFVWPSIVKIEHEHHHHPEKTIPGSSVDELQEKCTICNFEFTSFSRSDNHFLSINDQPYKQKKVENVRFNISAHSGFSFSLRAPPCKTL